EECRKCLSVWPETVRPEIRTHHFLCFLYLLDQPGQHVFQRRCFVPIFICNPLRLHESFVQRLSHPSVLVVQLTPNGNDMHAWDYLRALIVFAFNSAIIFEDSSPFSV